MKRLLLFSALSFLSFILSAQTNFINQDSVFAQSADCVGGVNACIDSINYDNIGDYRFTLDGAAYTGTLEACREDTIHTYSYFVLFQNSETGPFSLNSWVVNGQTYTIPNFGSLSQLLDSMRRWDPAGNWQLEPSAQIIYGFPLRGRTYSCQNITGLGRGGNNDVCYNVGFNFSGLKFRVPPGRHQFVVEQISTSFKDTVKLTAACIKPDTIRQTMFVGTTRAYCLNVSQLLGQPQLATFSNFCAKTTTNVTFDSLTSISFDTIYNYCINYTGRAGGVDTACMRVCDQYGVCDTTYLFITAEVNTSRFYLFQDTITVGLNRQKCNISLPPGTLNVFENYCPTRSGSEISFALDAGTRCVTYTGLGVGADTACVRVCNTLGVCDTTHFFITGQSVVLPPSGGGSHTFNDTITVGLNRQKCNLTMPSGTINVFQNLCAGGPGTNVTFALNAGTRCVTYTGATVGIDTACVRVCNTSNVCDTTTMLIEARPVVVLPPSGGTHIFNDTITVGLSREKCNVIMPSGAINIFENICPTRSGSQVTFALNGSTRCITYMGASVGTDTACLRVCNTSNVCDTTTLIIQAQSAVSPSNGGSHIFNDTITVGLNRRKCDIIIPSGTLNVLQNLCAGNSGTNVNFSLDVATRCITYAGVSVGIDTACVRVCNTSNVCDTTTFFIEAKAVVTPPSSRIHIFTDTLTIGLNRQKCNIIIPTGTINAFENLCPSASGTNVSFALDAATRCVTYQGLVVGFDTACVKVCNTEGVCDTTTFIIEVKPVPTVGSPRTHIFNDTITVGLIRSKCDFIMPTGATTIENICLTSSGTNIRFDVNPLTFCVTYSGITVGTDTACIKVCNPTTNLCDTTLMYVQGRTTTRPVVTPSVDTMKLRIFERKTFCPDSSELAGSPISLIKFCTPAQFDNSTITLDTVKKCVVVTGRAGVGVDTFCIALCSAAGFCDTTTLYVQVSPDTLKPRPSIDSFTLKIGELKVYCPDTLELLSGNVTSISSCTTALLDNSTLMFNNVTKCVESRGVRTGKDTACVIICNAVGLCDTTTLYITVTADTIKPVASIERITLRLGKDSLFTNIDSTQIFGSVDTLYDACPGKNGSHARMVLNRTLKNVAIKGVNIGVDTMCLVVCDTVSRLCDTTTVIVTVIDTIRLSPIQAYNDFDTTRLGRSITFQVYKNDTLNRLIPTVLTIVKPPLKGKADTISFRDGIIKYTAGVSPQACGLDSFRYRVCVDTVCAEANVIIDVKCAEGLKAFNAISPNGDSKNDAFYIEGLQTYPDNTLCVFNRWGNEVLKAKNYTNDWQGTWNGKDLPDGTYFYWLRNDASGEILMTGYLQILR